MRDFDDEEFKERVRGDGSYGVASGGVFRFSVLFNIQSQTDKLSGREGKAFRFGHSYRDQTFSPNLFLKQADFGAIFGHA